MSFDKKQFEHQLPLSNKPLAPKYTPAPLDFACPETWKETDTLTCETQGGDGCKFLISCKAYNGFKAKNDLIKIEDL